MTARRCHVFYQTQYTDTGDVLMQARWYSPGTGTFRSRDTYSGNLNTPVSLNRYTYAHNNPTRYWDPSGRNACQTADFCSGKVVDAYGVRTDRGTAKTFTTNVTRGGRNEGGRLGDELVVTTATRVAGDAVTEQFFEHGFSEAEVGRVIRARVYSEVDQNFTGQGFDVLLGDKVDRHGADVRAGLRETLRIWDETWLPGSAWFEGCNAALAASAARGDDYDVCSPNARMRVGADALAASPFAATKPLIGVGGGAVVAALSRGATRFGQTLTSLSDDFARVVSRCRTGCTGLSDDLAASRSRLIEYSVDDSLIFTGDMGATDAFGNITVRPGLSQTELIETVRHESVHSFFSIRGGPFQQTRANFLDWSYKRSNFITWFEEGLAESYATGSFRQGFSRDFLRGYEDQFSYWGVGAEVLGYTGAVGGTGYAITAGYPW